MADVLDNAREGSWSDARKAEAGRLNRGRGNPKKGKESAPSKAKVVKSSRFPLLKNPNLIERQALVIERAAR